MGEMLPAGALAPEKKMFEFTEADLFVRLDGLVRSPTVCVVSLDIEAISLRQLFEIIERDAFQFVGCGS